jgi:decaprenylphospho-beta-D-erythro-pentofuranosid-2-ulose 2-reductase
MKYLLVLGATSDMAYATAREFAEKGFGLYLAARNPERLAIIKSDLEARYEVPVQTFLLDITDYASHANFVASLPELPEITACFVGYLGDQIKGQSDFQEAQTIIQTNYLGAVSILNLLANLYETAGRGSLIGVSSVAGERGRQSNYLYGSAKAGFTAYLSGLRNRLFPKGIHVLTVKPGFVNTRMTRGLNLPKPLTAEPQEVGKAIYQAWKKKKDTLYVRPIWWLIMQNIKLIPETLFKRLKL